MAIIRKISANLSITCDIKADGALYNVLSVEVLYREAPKTSYTYNCQKRNYHTYPLFKKLYVLKIDDLKTLQEYKFFHKLVNKKLPKFFDTFSFTRHIDIHNYPTRRNCLHITPRLRYQTSMCSVRFRLPFTLNEAPNSILEKMSTHSIQGLCYYFKKTCVDLYPETCEIQSSYVCSLPNPPTLNV